MLKTLILLGYNLIRFCIHKIRWGKQFAVHPIQRISPFAAIKIFDQGTMRIGRNTEFAHGCDFEVHRKGHLSIGEKTYFNRYCLISAHQSVKIGAHCMFGPGVKIFDNNHRFSKKEGVSSTLSTDEIVIGNNCWIASDVIILKGCRIGDNCVIGAGCIVSENIPTGSLVKCQRNVEITPII